MSHGWDLRLGILRSDTDQLALTHLRLHGWEPITVRAVEQGEYLLVDAERGGSKHRIGVLYSAGVANATYKALAPQVEHIFVRGGISDENRKSFAYGITTPISALEDFFNLLATWNTDSAPGKFAPVAKPTSLPKQPDHRRLLSETPIDAIWLRLRQLGSVTLARKLVEGRAHTAGVSLSDDVMRTKAEGVAYALRNAIDYYNQRDVRNVSQRALNLYYGTMAFVFAEMLAAPSGATALAAIEDSTKYGHGLYTIDGPDGGLDQLVVGALASGLFPTWLKFLGLPTTSLSSRKPKQHSELANEKAWITVEQLFARIPEIADLYRDIFAAPPAWVSPHYDSDANKSFYVSDLSNRPRRSYIQLVDESTRLTKDDIAGIPGPLSEIAEVSADSPGRHFRAGLDHPDSADWHDVLKIHTSPFIRSAVIFPIFGVVNEFRATCLVLLYALSIVVRYRPSIWRRVQEGDLDHVRVLVEAFLAVVERVLPEEFLATVTGQPVVTAQPGSLFA